MKKKYVAGLLVVFAGSLFISACAGIARLNRPPQDVQESKLTELMDRWEAYDIYVAVWRGGQVRAILFDPRDGHTKILAEKWVEVQNKEELSSFVARMRSGRSPRLLEIIGPREKSFGYVYTLHSDLQTQVVDDHTIRVFEIRPRISPAA
jgi:hypothetical protein